MPQDKQPKVDLKALEDDDQPVRSAQVNFANPQGNDVHFSEPEKTAGPAATTTAPEFTDLPAPGPSQSVGEASPQQAYQPAEHQQTDSLENVANTMGAEYGNESGEYQDEVSSKLAEENYRQAVADKRNMFNELEEAPAANDSGEDHDFPVGAPQGTDYQPQQRSAVPLQSESQQDTTSQGGDTQPAPYIQPAIPQQAPTVPPSGRRKGLTRGIVALLVLLLLLGGGAVAWYFFVYQQEEASVEEQVEEVPPQQTLELSVGDVTTEDTRPVIRGTVSDPEAEVTVTINEADYIATVNEDGSWVATVNDQLEPGQYTILVTTPQNETLIRATGSLVVEAAEESEPEPEPTPEPEPEPEPAPEPAPSENEEEPAVPPSGPELPNTGPSTRQR